MPGWWRPGSILSMSSSSSSLTRWTWSSVWCGITISPSATRAAIPTFLLSELTRKHVTVALSGDGGDELFAGYERFAAGLAMTRYQQLPSFARTSIETLLALLPADALRGRNGQPATVLRPIGDTDARRL